MLPPPLVLYGSLCTHRWQKERRVAPVGSISSIGAMLSWVSIVASSRTPFAVEELRSRTTLLIVD